MPAMNPWIKSPNLFGSLMFMQLAQELQIRAVSLMGHLQALWLAALDQQEDGDLSAWRDEDIEAAAMWSGKDGLFSRALRSRGWITGSGLLSGWLDLAGDYLREKYRDNRKKLEAIFSKHDRKVRRRRTSSRSNRVVHDVVTSVVSLNNNNSMKQHGTASSLRSLSEASLRSASDHTQAVQAVEQKSLEENRELEEKKFAGAFHEFMDGILIDYLKLKPGDPGRMERAAVTAAYRRFGRAAKDILAFARGDAKKARQGVDAIGRWLAREGLSWNLDTVCKWFSDWDQDPESFREGAKRRR